jgi:hypothetical protein
LFNSCYADITSCFICNPFPFKILKISHNAPGMHLVITARIFLPTSALRYQTWLKPLTFDLGIKKKRWGPGSVFS